MINRAKLPPLARIGIAPKPPTLPNTYDHIRDVPSQSVVKQSPVPPMFPPTTDSCPQEDKTPVCNFLTVDGRLVTEPPNLGASPFPSVRAPALPPTETRDWLAVHTQKRGVLHQVVVGLVIIATLVGLTLAVVYTVINHNAMQRHIDEYNHRQDHMGE